MHEPDPAEPMVDERAPAPRLRLRAVHLALLALAVLSGAALFLAGYATGQRSAGTPGTPSAERALWAPFWDTYQAIRERYALDPVEPPKLVGGAIKGMIEALGDPYSAYFSPEAYKQSLDAISGRFEGIGARVSLQPVGSGGASAGSAGATPPAASGSPGAGGSPAPSAPPCTAITETCRLVVVEPIPGSPSEQAGLLAGDIIAAVDGTSLVGLAQDAAISLLRGPAGSVVTVSVERSGGAPFELRITRAAIYEPEVRTATLADGTVGYIAISAFSDQSAADAVTAVRDNLAAGRKALVLDLRGNPGGFTTAAQRIGSAFIDGGPLWWTQDSSGAMVATEADRGGVAIDPSIRLVVLIDRGSASASEILAGALQDDGRATLVGTRSFGKGTIQQWLPLDEGLGGFKLTIAKWLTPAKRWIHGAGLTPDIPIDDAAAAGSSGSGGSTPSASDPFVARALQVLGAGG